MKITPGANHAGSEMNRQLAKLLRDEGLDVIEVGNEAHGPDDDSPDSVIPSARGGLCCAHSSLRLGIDHDGVNVFYVGGRTMGIVVALNCTLNFLGGMLKGAGRHGRGLAK